MPAAADASAPDRAAVRVLPVDGMHCAACASKVERAAGAVRGVREASVSFATKRARISFDPSLTDLDAVARAVRRAGFALDIARDPAVRAARELAAARALCLRVAVGFALSLPLLVIAMSHGAIPALDGPAMPWVQLALAAPVYLWCGWPIHAAALVRLRALGADMNTLVSLGTSVAFVSSLWMLLAGHAAHAGGMGQGGHALTFEAAAVIIAFVLLGRWLEAKSTARAGEALRALSAASVPTARVIVDGAEREVSAAEITAGMHVVVRPGERLPIDGVVRRGESEVDESLLTGEPMPRLRRAGDRVYAGTLNALGALDIEASCAADGTMLAQIAGLVDEAQASKAAIARLADRVAAVFVPIVVVIAIAAFGAWMLFAPAEIRATRALEALVSVLVVACPCALGLATPVAIMVASGRAASVGVLFRHAAAFEHLARIDRIAFDKTGTLTEGRPAVTAVLPARGWSESGLLGLAAAAESRSEHAVARGIVDAARERGIRVEEPSAFAAFAGKGVFAQVLAHKVEVGNAAWMRECGVAVDAEPSHATRVFVAADGAFVGAIELADRVREHAREALDALRAQGVAPILVTGDARAPADAVGASLSIEPAAIHAEMTPAGKAELVARLASGPHGTAFVGDGLNDAAAIAAARPGVAMSGGTDLAKTSADILLVTNDLRRVGDAIELSRKTLRVIRQNLAWAFGYNLVLIPLAAGALYPWTGWMLPPILASAAMALSSVSVVANSLRLRR